jgi:hypothetical protein
MNGHRQYLSELLITDVVAAKPRKTAAKKTEKAEA